MSNRNRRNSDLSVEEMETDAAENAGIDSDEEGGLRVDEEIYIPPPPKLATELDANEPRLIITHIINENFKSYAGKKVIGPFHKCFSAIVGPNGSGKSNVIDSMLFVFGWRATQIRSKKISVLIHNSNQHPDIRSCCVSVQFERIIDKPGDQYDIVPNGGFIISRTAFKDNSSFYTLNGKKVQFKEIGKVLRSNGVDLDHNRFLILQGEVEQIAMMKPKGQSENDTGMLEFLEDIIGTSRYKEPLEKLSDKVEALTEYRVEKLNRLRVVEKEKKDLEEPMQDAVQYLKYENAIIKLEHQLYHCRRLEVQQDLAGQEEKKAELDNDMGKLTEGMNVVRAKRMEKDAEVKEKCKKWDKLQHQKDKLKEKYDEIKKQDEALHAELVETNKRRKANMALVKSEKVKLEELGKVPEKNAKDIQECEELSQKCAADHEKEEAALTTLMSGLKEKTAPLLDQRTKLETDLISLRQNVDQAKAAFEMAQSELQLYTSAEHSEKAKLEELQQTLENTIQTLSQRKEQLKTFEARIPATESSLQEAKTELDQVKKREFDATAQLRTMRVRVEEQRSAMHASKSRNRVLNALMEEKRQGNFPGILGRLGDLGAIDSKYDVAISTACGPLDNIVVDTVDTAQACIAYLRQNDIGRATFIALEKQQRFLEQCRQRIQTPENVPRLFDLIKVEDDRVLPAFYYGLQNTLVANDLEQATRIAYGAQRHRVVTLKGELIETAGTMSGGGRTVLRGRMGQSVVRAEPCTADVDKLQTDLDAVYENCNQLRARQQPLEDQIHTLTTSLNDMKMDRQKFSIEVKSLTQQEPLLRSQLKAQQKKAAETVSDPAKVQQLTKTVEANKKVMTKAEAASKTTEDKVAKINGEIEEISGGRVKIQQKKITDLAKKIEKSKAEVCRLQVAIKTAERNARKTEQHIETLENDVQKSQERIHAIQKEKVELEEVGKNLLEQLNEVAEQLLERDDVSGSLKEELNALQIRENKMKAMKIELDQKVNEMNKILKELRQRIPDYTKRIEVLKLQDIPGEAREELQALSEEDVRELDIRNIASHLQRAKERLPEDVPNMQLIKDYQEKDALYIQRVADLEKITLERNKMRDIYEDARRRRAQEFLSGFSIITGKLKEMYQMITLGGDAELELVDSLDPFSEGIVFSVRPPKKSWKNISNLSGGEKTLSSLALVFALHHYKPTPLYFMDEIDAALDFKNVSIVGNYIKERTKDAQFIVISLRSNMFELADCLVGIYKTYNCTKCCTLNVRKVYELHGPPPAAPTAGTGRYGSSQGQKPFSQLPPGHSRQNQPHLPATCPANLQEAPTALENAPENTSLNLPELGLCRTPEKSPNRRGRISEEVENDDEDDMVAQLQPQTKKRKL